jgi:hypothetical protein
MLEADQTKASRVDERPLLAFMQYLLQRYGRHGQATDLIRCGSGNNSDDEENVMPGVEPPCVRRAVKTTSTLHGGAYPELAQVTLDHGSVRVSDEHYDASSNLEASRELSALVQALRREVKGD